MVSLASWKDRLNFWMDRDDFPQAFRMAEAFYDGTITFAVTDIPENSHERSEKVGAFIDEMMTRFLNTTLDPEKLKKYAPAADLVNLLIGILIKVGRIDLIFGIIYNSFCKLDLLDSFVSID